MVEAVAGRLRRVLERPDRLRIAALVRWAKLTGRSVETTVGLVNGMPMRVVLPETVSTVVAYEGIFEPEVYAFMRHVLVPGDIFLDVGAQFGLFSMLAAGLCGGAKVHAFEPVPENRRLLNANCNHLGVNVVPMALSDWEGQAEMRVFPVQFSGSNTLASMARVPEHVRARLASQTRVITVRTTTIDWYCLEWEVVQTLVKVDAEGLGGKVVAGAETTINKHHPAFILETGGDDGVGLLGEHGYVVYVYTKAGQKKYDGGEGVDNVLAVWEGGELMANACAVEFDQVFFLALPSGEGTGETAAEILEEVDELLGSDEFGLAVECKSMDDEVAIS